MGCLRRCLPPVLQSIQIKFIIRYRIIKLENILDLAFVLLHHSITFKRFFFLFLSFLISQFENALKAAYIFADSFGT